MLVLPFFLLVRFMEILCPNMFQLWRLIVVTYLLWGHELATMKVSVSVKHYVIFTVNIMAHTLIVLDHLIYSARVCKNEIIGLCQTLQVKLKLAKRWIFMAMVLRHVLLR